MSGWETQNPIASNILVVRSPALLGVRGYQVIVKDPRDKSVVERIPIATLSAVILYGKHIGLSTAVLDRLLQQRVPIVLVTRDALATVESPHLTSTPEARWAQYRYLSDPTRRILLARALIRAKIEGYASVARYLARRSPEHAERLREGASIALGELEALETASTARELMSVEARASQHVWESLRATLLSGYENLGFHGRNPRSGDPINQAVNYLHAMIYSHVTRALITAGLDPHLGALHREGYGKTPLTYDFSEQFKPIALRAVVSAARTATLRTSRTGLLTKSSLRAVTGAMARLLRSGSPPPLEAIYKRAWHLRKAMKSNSPYRPYVYRPR